MIKFHEPESREEYDALMAEVVSEADSTGERAALMDAKVADAIQAHRQWAMESEQAAKLDGYSRQIKDYLKRTRVVVALTEKRSITKPATVGTKQMTSAGKWVDVQLPLEVLTFDQLRQKRGEYLRQRKSYDDNIAVADRLLALEEMSPGAVTPADACAAIGTSLEDYLGEAQAS